MKRAIFLGAVRALEGVPYLWGGKTARGLDCSGLVTLALHASGGPDLRANHNSAKLWEALPAITAPHAGDLAMYGRDGRVSHVVVCLGGVTDPIIGANGGDSTTTSVAAADARKAAVRRAKSPTYRPDLMGYRSTGPWWGES